MMPPVGATPVNFLIGPDAVRKARKRFENEVGKGRMLGGKGWTREKLKISWEKRFTQFHVGLCQKMVTKTDELFTIIASHIKMPYQ